MTKLALYFHNHQPVGNFDEVFEYAYQHSYRPLLESLARHKNIKFGIHNSGPLSEWLESHHPEYFELLRAAVASGQAEILSSAFSEPILSLIPKRDLADQIKYHNDYLCEKFGVRPRGLWLTERVWEPSLVPVLIDAGIEYTLLDDTHFRYAGLSDEELVSSFITEEDGKILRVFPISMKLRYLIPFHPIEETVEFLREESSRQPGGLKCLGDDGEKFGVWPGTYQWVYGHNWLENFLARLEQESWINTVHLGDEARQPSAGRVYLPTASYEEMGEWVLSARAGHDYNELKKMVDKKYFYLVHGGYFKNFLAKYPEANMMHKRMLYVSHNAGDDIDARRALWRGQCSCAYWHGIFGGLYLPHLREGIYKNLIEADNANIREGTVECDFDADGREELVVSTGSLFCVVRPETGSLIEFDDRKRKTNLLNYLGRRKEKYHANLLAKDSGDQIKSIHEVVRSKSRDLANLLIYDRYERGFGIDHLLTGVPTAAEFCQHALPGAIVTYCRREPVAGSDYAFRFASPELEKTLTISKNRAAIEIAYRGDVGIVGIEFSLGIFNRGLKVNGTHSLYEPQKVDDLSGFAVSGENFEPVVFKADRPFAFLSYPIETVSSSEAGYEKNFQGFSILLVFNGAPRIEVTT